MIDKLKENGLAIVVFSFLLFLGCKDTIHYMQSEKQALEYEMDMYIACQRGELPAFTCENYQEKPVKRDVISTFAYISTNENIYPLQIYAPFLIMLVAGTLFHKQLRNGGFKNILTRMSFSRWLNTKLITSFFFCICIQTILFIPVLLSGLIAVSFYSVLVKKALVIMILIIYLYFLIIFFHKNKILFVGMLLILGIFGMYPLDISKQSYIHLCFALVIEWLFAMFLCRKIKFSDVKE